MSAVLYESSDTQCSEFYNFCLFLPGNSSKSGSEEIQEKRWRHKVPEPKEELVDVPKT